MILEGLVTSRNERGEVNVSPMGPRVEEGEIRSFLLRPFSTSQTARNLCRGRYGVLHVTDDVELLAWAAVRKLDPLPPLQPLANYPADILVDACRWYAFHVERIDDSEPRLRLECRVVERGGGRDFFGFNRAKHAVLEAAILATRVEILSRDEIEGQMRHLALLVEKTAGEQERRAFAFLEQYLRECWQVES
jgi:uncharacterized protein